MHVPLWVWSATIIGISLLLAISFFIHMRKPHEPTFKEAAAWTAFFVTISVLFGLGMMKLWSPAHGLEFFAGYITEYSLSMDNLFVFILIMSSFQVPRMYQQKILVVGIVIALIMRTLFIVAGAAAIARFSWVFYLFGLFLLFTSVKLMFSKPEENATYEPNIFVRLFNKVMPISDHYDKAKLTTVINGKRYVTPMLVVMFTIGMTDILFALDSIPAIFGLTTEPYIVFSANAFALLGLIELYFLIGGLLKRLVYLATGLALVLAFIGIKLILEAMHTNSLSFINGGEPIANLPHISTELSLIVILGILSITTLASLIKSRER